jgi:amidase
MTDLDLCYMPATEALKRFKSRKLSPVELMKAVVARAEAVEPQIGAFTFKYYDEALKKARQAEARWAKGSPKGPLDGLPVAIKDESYIRGYPTSNASFILKDFVPDTTSATNERLLDAGIIFHARTATPEFSCAGVTYSKMWGVTRNPWNREYTPGGSSGGSGASLAAGTTTLATGSDIGGSIRIPSSQCGLVGFKPPYGRNPDDPPFSFDFYNHTGPMARTVADCALLQNVMSGPHPRDIATVKPKITLPKSFKDIKGWRIAYSIDLGMFEVDRQVEANTRAALSVFKSLGAKVEEIDLGWDKGCFQAGFKYLDHLFGALMNMHAKQHRKVMSSYAVWFADQSARSTTLDFLDSLMTAGRMYATLGPLLEKYDVLICPTTALPEIVADFDYQRNMPIRINGRKVDHVLGWAMTTCFNTMSRCPVLSVPSGHTKSGMPTGIQIVGPTFEDEKVFQAASAYEKAVGGWFRSRETRPAL